MPRIRRKATARSTKPGNKLPAMVRQRAVLKLPKNGHELTSEHDEHYHQVYFVAWFRQQYPDVLIFAIPNGGGRSKAEGGRLKAEGVVPGIPDLYVPQWRLWIEMKRPEKGRVSSAQAGIIKYLRTIGHTCVVCFGFSDAVAQTTAFKELV